MAKDLTAADIGGAKMAMMGNKATYEMAALGNKATEEVVMLGNTRHQWVWCH